MLRFLQILVSAIVLASSAVSLSACGQQGPLYLPPEPAAVKRTTWPEAQTVPAPASQPAHAASAATPAPQ
ncbi:MAG: lipoprotein [Rhodoferax sp.]|uniref:LPS translocon maturation chaperone LptM n=1 Tax=Rhodoferax sp. TaxID=50421 RepID=UPI0013FFE03B|nr:lipoprotein [Rhodoferax sp.]NDP39075.1 lipoprotein [Rhodoferax sp.]